MLDELARDRTGDLIAFLGDAVQIDREHRAISREFKSAIRTTLRVPLAIKR
jgi:hypothetical protein